MCGRHVEVLIVRLLLQPLRQETEQREALARQEEAEQHAAGVEAKLIAQSEKVSAAEQNIPPYSMNRLI
jgi:hypothetical protein